MKTLLILLKFIKINTFMSVSTGTSFINRDTFSDYIIDKLLYQWFYVGYKLSPIPLLQRNGGLTKPQLKFDRDG